MQDLYELLGINRGSVTGEIKSAYRKACAELLARVNAGDEVAVERQKSLNLAYEVLSDPNRRKVYEDSGDVGVENPDDEVDMILKSYVHDAMMAKAERPLDYIESQILVVHRQKEKQLAHQRKIRDQVSINTDAFERSTEFNVTSRARRVILNQAKWVAEFIDEEIERTERQMAIGERVLDALRSLRPRRLTNSMTNSGWSV